MGTSNAWPKLKVRNKKKNKKNKKNKQETYAELRMLWFLYIDVIFVKVIYEHNEIVSLFYQFFTNVIFSRNIICKQSMTRALFKKQKKCHNTSNPF